jgi:hypothetical protein
MLKDVPLPPPPTTDTLAVGLSEDVLADTYPVEWRIAKRKLLVFLNERNPSTSPKKPIELVEHLAISPIGKKPPC